MTGSMCVVGLSCGKYWAWGCSAQEQGHRWGTRVDRSRAAWRGAWCDPQALLGHPGRSAARLRACGTFPLPLLVSSVRRLGVAHVPLGTHLSWTRILVGRGNIESTFSVKNEHTEDLLSHSQAPLEPRVGARPPAALPGDVDVGVIQQGHRDVGPVVCLVCLLAFTVETGRRSYLEGSVRRAMGS